MPVNPRRVRGGVKLRAKPGEAPGSWIADRMNRVIELAADGERLREGLEYARLGQVRRLGLGDGRAEGLVQGRADRAYRTTLRLRPFDADEQGRIIAAMADQAIYAAKLLAGELPSNIEDLFGPLGLKLFPTDPGEVETVCTCAEGERWCKHAVCVAALLAERLGDDPFLIFGLRGMPGEELVERLRERRSLAGQGEGPALVYTSRVAGVSDGEAPVLESCAAGFWEAGPELGRLDLPLDRPDVSHVLLRRLGQSPFTEGRFPLVGLLATCYEVISEHALRAAEDPEDVARPGRSDD